ncbi:MAG TPA: hypothetical protein VM536_01085 [Chloroflexia bacterium]|nr:hypothetical protein [Chloroflexia bacterium]
MANPASARVWDDLDAPPATTKQRSWANTVDYDMIDAQPDAPAPSMSAPRARRAAAPSTQRLYAMPGGRDQVTFRPSSVGAPTSALPAAAPQRAYHPEARGSAAPAVRAGMYMLGAAAVVLVLYLAVSALVGWTQTKLDDMTYGNPRTTHLDAVVGNGDTEAQPTHFIALNLNREVSVIVLPGGDISKAVAINGPYLFGDGENLTPVKMHVEDINGDAKPDLLLTVKNEELAYINDQANFRPITAEEKAAVEQASAPSLAAPAK